MAAKFIILVTTMCFAAVWAQQLQRIISDCEANGVPNAAEQIRNASEAMTQCEIEVDKTITDELLFRLQSPIPVSLHHKFRAFCNKWRYRLGCMRSYSNVIYKCTTVAQSQKGLTILGSMENVFDYACSRGMEELKSYIREGGEDCYDSKVPELIKCWVGKPDETILTFDKNQCNQLLSRIRDCTVNELKKCSNPTVVESAFDYIKNDISPCIFF